MNSLSTALIAAMIVILTGLNTMPFVVRSYIVELRDPSHSFQRFAARLLPPPCPNRQRLNEQALLLKQQQHLINNDKLQETASDGWQLVENVNGSERKEQAARASDGWFIENVNDDGYKTNHPPKTNEGLLKEHTYAHEPKLLERSSERETALRANKIWVDGSDKLVPLEEA